MVTAYKGFLFNLANASVEVKMERQLHADTENVIGRTSFRTHLYTVLRLE